jgi:hypothetical protein
MVSTVASPGGLKGPAVPLRIIKKKKGGAKGKLNKGDFKKRSNDGETAIAADLLTY